MLKDQLLRNYPRKQWIQNQTLALKQTHVIYEFGFHTSGYYSNKLYTVKKYTVRKCSIDRECKFLFPLQELHMKESKY